LRQWEEAFSPAFFMVSQICKFHNKNFVFFCFDGLESIEFKEVFCYSLKWKID